MKRPGINAAIRSAEPLGRFPEIEEDERVLYNLGNEYPAAD
jgi:hypothetical protein